MGGAVEKEFLEGDFLGRPRVVRRDCRSGRVGGEANLLERFRLGQRTGFGNGTRFGGGWPRRFVRSRLLAGTLQTETQCPRSYCHQEPNP
jgi:hypothetical protein